MYSTRTNSFIQIRLPGKHLHIAKSNRCLLMASNTIKKKQLKIFITDDYPLAFYINIIYFTDVLSKNLWHHIVGWWSSKDMFPFMSGTC